MTSALIGIKIGMAAAVRWTAQHVIYLGQILIKTAYGWWRWSDRVLETGGLS